MTIYLENQSESTENLLQTLKKLSTLDASKINV